MGWKEFKEELIKEATRKKGYAALYDSMLYEQREKKEKTKFNDWLEESGLTWSPKNSKATKRQLELQHRIHLQICKETYNDQRADVLVSDFSNDKWTKIGETTDTVMYYLNGKCILGYRGTQFNITDIKSDWQLATKASDCNFERSENAKNQMLKFIQKTKNMYDIQVTGHSLGGSVARCVGAHFNLVSVSFNAAAPPTKQTITTRPPQVETNYHIVGDFISAWLGPNCRRWDVGVRPLAEPIPEVDNFIANAVIGAANKLTKSLPFLAELKLMEAFLELVVISHSLDTFNTSGIEMSATDENVIYTKWWQSMPLSLQAAFKIFLKLTTKSGLPEIPGAQKVVEKSTLKGEATRMAKEEIQAGIENVGKEFFKTKK